VNVYQIFKHPEKGYQAVKRGFSWPGFFFGFIWAFSRQLWLPAILLLLFSIAVDAFFWTVLRGAHGFAAVVGLLYSWFVGANGNFWRARSLEAWGFVPLGAINARDQQDALSKIAASGGIIAAELRAATRQPAILAVPPAFQGLFAIIILTWKAAFRYRLFWVIMTLLLGAVIGLPLILKHDGTAEGFAQILITYTLGTVTALLGLCTLWLGCGTLARDVEECQIQMVAVKPIARWQIWFGKWLGLVTLNAALLAIVGVSLYCLLAWRSRGLSEYELAKLQTQVLVARASAREQNVDQFVADETDRRLNDQVKKKGLEGLDPTTVKKRLSDQVRAELQSVSPNKARRWIIHVGLSQDQLRGQPLYLRIKFNAAESGRGKTYEAYWRVDDPGEKMAPYYADPMSLTADAFHEFPVPSELVDDKGDVEILYLNQNPSTILFPLEDGMEVLYRQGGFALNLMRGLAIILCWMALLAALGLAAASFLSFPVAAFCSLAILSVGLSGGTLSSVVADKSVFGVNEESGAVQSSLLDRPLVLLFSGILKVINLVQQFSPVDSLSTGRSVSWSQLGLAVSQIVLLLGGALALFGIFVFSRRELATAQGNH